MHRLIEIIPTGMVININLEVSPMYYGGQGQGMDCCYPISPAPSYGYGYAGGGGCGGGCGGGGGFGSGFALIVVLFILLIIVGACLC